MPSMRRGGPGHGARRQYDPDGRGTKSGKRYLGDKIKEHWQNAQQGLSMFNAIRTFSEGRLFVLDSGVLIVDFSWIVHRVAPMFAWELVQLAFGDENLDPLSAAQAEEIFTKLATGLMREIWKALAPTNRPLPTGYRVVIIHELTAESAKELLRKEGPGVSLPETTAELDELLSRHGDSCPLRPLPLLVPGYQGGAAVAALGSAVPTNGDAAPAEAANFNFLRKTDVERESRTRSSASAASKGIKRVLVVHGDGFKRTNKVVDPRTSRCATGRDKRPSVGPHVQTLPVQGDPEGIRDSRYEGQAARRRLAHCRRRVRPGGLCLRAKCQGGTRSQRPTNICRCPDRRYRLFRFQRRQVHGRHARRHRQAEAAPAARQGQPALWRRLLAAGHRVRGGRRRHRQHSALRNGSEGRDRPARPARPSQGLHGTGAGPRPARTARRPPTRAAGT
ncbi:hypothetical protein DFJ74DRAFT_185028 [Hyaloraphidium curvatum]|nr:hypothetical protein DFJ74DRAFT_185028 [Hyaloraphidium curvatum]